MRTFCLTCLLMTTTFALLACTAHHDSSQPELSPTNLQPSQPASAPDPRHFVDPLGPKPRTEIERWRDHLLFIAGEYRKYTKLSDDPSWAPTLCRAPMATGPLLSRATTTKLHGQKLYYLWVKDSDAYEHTLDFAISDETSEQLVLKPQPIGQALVKESFHPKQPGVRVTGDPAPLFVMFKVDPSTEGSDVGWVYGTLTPDGKTITAAGRIAACMDCHGVHEDRLFGPSSSDFRVPRTGPEDK